MLSFNNNFYILEQINEIDEYFNKETYKNTINFLYNEIKININKIHILNEIKKTYNILKDKYLFLLNLKYNYKKYLINILDDLLKNKINKLADDIYDVLCLIEFIINKYI